MLIRRLTVSILLEYLATKMSPRRLPTTEGYRNPVDYNEKRHLLQEPRHQKKHEYTIIRCSHVDERREAVKKPHFPEK
jgi:hypothetical protein